MGVCASRPDNLIPGIEVHPTIWRLPSSSEPFPELQELPGFSTSTLDVAVCMQGGGVRGAIISFGALVGLERLGVLPNVRYMAGVSGSSLPIAPLCFLPEKHAVAEFFGPLPTGPAALTEQEVANPLTGSYPSTLLDFTGMAASAACDLVTQDLRYLFSCCNTNEATCCGCPFQLHAYTKGVTYPVMSPWDLYIEGSVMSAPVGSDAYKRAIDAVGPAGCRVTPMRQGMPFPIILSSRLIEADGHDSSWCTYEATPLYCGSPVDMADAPGGAVGCGVIESFGVGSKPPAGLPNGRTAVENGERVKVKPTTFTPMPLFVGSSAGDMYTYSMFHDCTPGSANQTVAMGGNALPVWSPADITSKNNGHKVLEDGGPTDSCGLLACLRRGVKKVFLQGGDGFDIADPTIHHIGNASWWPAYFGEVRDLANKKYSVTAAEMNKVQQVFDNKYYLPLVNELKEKSRAGLPVTADLKLPVLPNRFAGVKGGYEVHLLMALPCRPAAFLNALPEPTRTQMTMDPGKKIDLSNQIPFTASFGSYTMPAIRMEIELAAWTLMNGFSEKTLRDFFGPPGGAAATSRSFPWIGETTPLCCTGTPE